MKRSRAALVLAVIAVALVAALVTAGPATGRLSTRTPNAAYAYDGHSAHATAPLGFADVAGQLDGAHHGPLGCCEPNSLRLRARSLAPVRVGVATEEVGPTVGELRGAGLKDAHHIIQDAAVRDLEGYSRTAFLNGPAPC